MTDQEHAAITFIKNVFAASTNAPVYVCSLANERDNPKEPPERHVSTRDPDVVMGHIKKWDRHRRGFFYCVSTMKSGGRRAKENAVETPMLHADIDFKDVGDTQVTIERKLNGLRHPPSIIVRSGNGIHAYWLFKEALDSQAERERIEQALRQIADVVGGDPSVCEVARLMRLPGTHNTKRGLWDEVYVVTQTDLTYELDDLEDWLAEQSPVIVREIRPATPTNPFLEVASRLGFKPPIDVEQRLSAMCYQGAGDASIHATQLAVSASLLSRGEPLEEVVNIVMSATKAAAGQYGERWNWRREERAVLQMCEGWVRKNPSRAIKQADATLAAAREREAAVNGGSSTVVNLAAAREAKTPKQRKQKGGEGAQNAATIVADGVIEAVRRAGQDIMLSEGEVWIYSTGTWHVMTPADEQWLLTLIQEGFEALGEPCKTASLTTSLKRLKEHPGLYKREVPWADGSFIVCQNGVLRIADKAFLPHSPLHFAKRKIGASYDPNVKCPQLLELLQSMFADRGLDRAGYINVVQEFAGAALAIGHLSREERKALILVGPSRTGKTELSRILRLLIGEPIATPSVAEISERFGLSSLYESAAWIRDDAINEGDNLDPQRFKTIVTGEPIDIERKHKPAVSGVELTIPILLTTNSLPRARDKSDAIFNRSIVLEMTNIVSEESAYALRQTVGVPRGTTIGQYIWQREGAGILNWALDGLGGLLERGSYDLPDNVRNALQRFKDDNNPVGEWARIAVQKSPHGKVSRHDLMCAYHGWQREQDGDEARALGARAFFPRLRAASPNISDTTDAQGRRYVTGLHLTDEGLQLWDLHSKGPQLKGGSKGLALSKVEVNKVILTVEKAPENERKNDDKTPRF